jgi:hypothetical protein
MPSRHVTEQIYLYLYHYQMEVSGELHVTAVLARDMTHIPTGWTQEQAGRFEEDNICFPYRLFEPGPSNSLSIRHTEYVTTHSTNVNNVNRKKLK